MKKNPSINELLNDAHYELATILEHRKIKEFVFGQIGKGGKITLFYMVYQLLMMLIGVVFFGYAVYKCFKGNCVFLGYATGALVFSFSAMVVAHELIHGLALKFTGAKNIHYGGNLRKFIFYAEADRHVLNRKQFYFVAMAPLVVVKAVSLACMVIFYAHPCFFFFVLVMCTHSLFCAGDIALMGFFASQKPADVYTFDDHQEKKSYFFRKVNC